MHGGDNLDETSQKIIDAAMMLVRDNGYVATTTKAIAKAAGVNECTLFRKFKNKKDIVLQGVNQAGWRANITPEIFENVQWDLQADIEMFMKAYMDRMTPDFVNLSIGLRAPQLYEETSALIMKVPQAFLSSFTQYLNKMFDLGKIPKADFDALALTVFSSTFGYAFLNASFVKSIIPNKAGWHLPRKAYKRNTVIICSGNTSNKIGGSRSACHKADTHFSCGTGISVCRMD